MSSVSPDRTMGAGAPATAGSSTPSDRGIIAWLLQQCRGMLAPLAAATFFGVLNAAAGVIVLLSAVSAVLTALRGGSPVPWILLIIALSLGKAAARYLEQYLGHRVAFSALARLRVLFYRALTPQAPAITASARSGELSGIATRDIDRVEVFFAHTMPPAVIAVVVPIASIVWLGLAVDPVLAAPLLLVWLLVVAVIPWLGARGTSRAQAGIAASNGELGQALGEQLQGAREVQANDATERMTDALDAIAARSSDRDAAVASRRAVRKAAVTAVTLGGQLAVVALGVANGVDGAAVLLALAVAIALVRPSSAVDGFAADLSASLAAARRLRAAMERAPAVVDTAGALERGRAADARADASGTGRDVRVSAVPESAARAGAAPESAARAGAAPEGAAPEGAAPDLFELRDAGLRIDGVSILEPLRWRLPRGGHHAVVGVSGSGKSSLLSLLLRVRDASDGVVLYQGTELAAVPLDELRSRIAMTTQRPDIFSGTLREALQLRAPDADDEQLRASLRLAMLDEWFEGLPDGLDTMIRQGGRSLSGGQRQRLALARSVVVPPELLVLDESTGQLDAATETQLRARLSEWSSEHGVTLLEVTHRVERVLDADSVLVLDNGIAVEAGLPQQLAAGDGPFARLLQRRGR